jgi:catechol 2,3-dioxygenase-like lactoylglutathione lyase family enzyme
LLTIGVEKSVQHIFGIDHLALLVRDLESASTAYEKLGFRVSARQLHSANMGSANHIFNFSNSYVELIGLIAETDFNKPWLARLDKREGLYIISTRTDDVAGAVSELRQKGISTSDSVPHSRPAMLASGEQSRVSFGVTYVDAEFTPAAHISVCEHHDPDKVYCADREQHANTATSIKTVIISTPTPLEVAEAYLPIYGNDAIIEKSTEKVILSTAVEDANIEFMTSSSIRHSLGLQEDIIIPDNVPFAVVFEVSDIDRTTKQLDDNNIPKQLTRDSVLVPATHAAGTMIVFSPC